MLVADQKRQEPAAKANEEDDGFGDFGAFE